MRVKQSVVPNLYSSLQEIKVFDDDDLKVTGTETHDEEVYYHVVSDPPICAISSPDDIKTYATFKVGEDETEEEVKEQALDEADEIIDDE